MLIGVFGVDSASFNRPKAIQTYHVSTSITEIFVYSNSGHVGYHPFWNDSSGTLIFSPFAQPASLLNSRRSSQVRYSLGVCRIPL